MDRTGATFQDGSRPPADTSIAELNFPDFPELPTLWEAIDTDGIRLEGDSSHFPEQKKCLGLGFEIAMAPIISRTAAALYYDEWKAASGERER